MPVPMIRRPMPQRAGNQVPLKSILGRPGKFFDVRTKKVYDISQAYEGEKYDTIAVLHGAGANPPGTEYPWFMNPQVKRAIDTNFKTANRLDPNERLVLERIGLYLHMGIGNTLMTSFDVRKVLESGYIKLTINDDILWDGIATWLPSGYGIVGQTTDTDSTFASVGVAGTAAAARLRRKQMITSDHSLGGSLIYQNRAWIAAGGGAAYVDPVMVNDVLLKIVLHGPISRPATR